MAHPPMIIPAHAMTEEERQGFRMAIGCFEAWGYQLEHSAVTLPGMETVPVSRVQRLTGRAVQQGAKALALTLLHQSVPSTLPG